jgi:hypothetical protein
MEVDIAQPGQSSGWMPRKSARSRRSLPIAFGVKEAALRLRYFGDSYDIVKQALISWLGSMGAWEVLPMFTEPVDPNEASRFAAFLQARLVSCEVLDQTNRSRYFTCCQQAGNLLLDPDTGLRLRPLASGRAVEYLFASEVIQLAQARPEALTLVFDQSVARGQERSQIETKLSHLRENGLHAFAYISHACFLLVGQSQDLVDRSYSKVREMSRLPDKRFAGISEH